MRRFPELLARFIVRRPWWLLVIAIVITAAVAPGIARLRTETGLNTLVSPGSQVFQDNARYEEQFGGDEITVLLAGDMDNIFSTHNLAVIKEFEQTLAQDPHYRSLMSPATILEMASAQALQAGQALQQEVERAQETAAQQARQAAAAQGLGTAEQEMAAQQAKAQVMENLQPQLAQMEALGEPSLDNPAFVKSVLYGPDGSISPAMAPLVPDDKHALILITPVGNMEDDEAQQSVTNIESFFSTHPLDGVKTTVTGDAKVMKAISESIGNNMALLLGLAVVVMIVILALTFQVRWRVLSLLMVGVGAVWTFGFMGYVSVPLSMATMAVLPILIGLGIDYAIQLHNRYQEETTRNPSAGEALITSIIRMFPVIGIALLATIIGFITLYISDVPMIRDFGVILTVGIVLACVVALFLLHSILYLRDREAPLEKLGQRAASARRRGERILSSVVGVALKHPLPILLTAAALGIAGGVVDRWLPINTDYEQLMPQSIPELRDLRELRSILGYGGEVSFMVEADNVADPDFLRWLKAYQDEALARHPELVSVNSPATLVSSAAGGAIPDAPQVEQILKNTPPLYVGQVISGDGKIASVSFLTGHIPLQRTHDLLNAMAREAQPPDGVRLSPVGTLALASSTVDAVVGTRLLMNLLCLGAVFVVLLLIYRRPLRALLVVLPVGLVIGVASLIMYIAGIALNPLTAILGVIMIGINTEFMVLLSGRYEEEKRKEASPRRAMMVAVSNLGRAIVATGLTTLGGFGVLIASNFVMISDFGMVTVIGVFLCLVSTVVVMPPLIVWLDERKMRKSPGQRARDVALAER